MNTAARWDEVVALFHEISETPIEQRESLLASRCKGDEALRAEVESLLEVHDSAADGDPTLLDAPLEPLSESAAELVPGRKLGPYTVLRELGKGGMSTVFLAARNDDEFDRLVAVKMMRTAAASAELFERFRIERQVLADLEHPAIARLYEGGTSSSGLPYIVMEYVADGLRIDDYCEERALSIQQRVELFRTVCEAVSYAHRRLVVHRDIKPTNILVTGEGAPKLLDFGISKLLSPQSQDFTLTLADIGPMTPAYASPEQLLGQTITTASDVFSLGVLLHKLLTGALPFGASMGERVQELTQGVEPKLPSERAVDLGSADSSVLYRALDRGRREDLDAIILKALELKPEERYPSVGQLIEDLDRWGASMPVRARKLTTAYRLSRAIRRNRLPVALAGLATAALIGGATGIVHQSRRAAEQRDIAQEAAEESSSLVELLVGIFEQADPSEARGADVTVREVLEEAEPRIGEDLAEQPQLRGRLLDTIGQVYVNLGLMDDAWRVALEAADALDPSSAEFAINLELRGTLAHYEGDHEEALALYRAAHAEHLARAEKSADVARVLTRIAYTFDRLARFKEAEDAARQAIQMLDELGVDNHSHDGIEARLFLAEALFKQRRDDEALPLIEAGLEDARRALGDDHPLTLVHLMKAAVVALEDEDRLSDAEAYANEFLAMSRKVYDGDHQTTARALDTLANVRRRRGDLEGARELFEEALAMFRRIDGEESLGIAIRLTNLAWFLLFHADNPVSAEPLFRQSLAIEEASFPGNAPLLAYPLIGIGISATRTERPEEGEPYLRRAASIRHQAYGSADTQTATANIYLAECLIQQSEFEEADALLLEASGILLSQEAESSDLDQLRTQVTQLYQAWQRPIPSTYADLMKAPDDG